MFVRDDVVQHLTYKISCWSIVIMIFSSVVVWLKPEFYKGRMINEKCSNDGVLSWSENKNHFEMILTCLEEVIDTVYSN